MRRKITGRAYFLYFCIGFCLGVLIINIGKDILLDATGFLSEDTLYRMKYMEVESNAIFCYVLRKRLTTALILIISCTTYLGLLACWGIVLWYGMSVGIFLYALIVRYGIKGILLAIVSVFPHYILYVPTMLILLVWCEELYRGIYRRQGGLEVHDKRGMLRKTTHLLGILIMLIMGCALEGYINSLLLIKFLRFF